ncbi:transporter substrate-binding domain-containing protein [Glaciimonas sp. GS1]|uniref:Transporter substrate-binding domain-containing protein n=2 Tax=Glaciimonas soli TaxID=2590999 RepID=A0A843YSZ8_9BURK|nr:transporter substrate-binding domain-containing protein [Glaciimonas soli]
MVANNKNSSLTKSTKSSVQRLAELSGLAVLLSVSVASFAANVAPNTGNNSVINRIRDTKTLTIAYRDAAIPFSFLDQNKKPVGYTIDLCLQIAEAIKQQLKLSQLTIAYVPVSTSNRIDVIASGKADLECGTTTNTAERRQHVAFTIPHFMAATRMVVRTNSGIKNWPDLRDKKVATTKGTTSVKSLADRGQVRALNMTVVEGSDHNESFGMVVNKTADAFAMDDVLLYGLRAAAKDPEAYMVVGDPLTTEPYAIMLSKQDPAFKALVDQDMASIIQDGELNSLYKKWFLSPIPAKNMMNMNMPMGYLFKESLRFPSDKVAN